MRTNEIKFLVNWGDTDMAGIVYYPNYMKWFDIAGHHFFRSCDLSPSRLEQEEEIILPILDVRCTFVKPLYYEDVITVRTRVNEINNKTIKLNHEVWRGEERTGFGYELRGWVKKEKQGIKAVPIPEKVRSILNHDVHTKSDITQPLFNA